MPKTGHTTRTTTTNTMEQHTTPPNTRTQKIPNKKQDNTQQPRHNHTPTQKTNTTNNNTKHTKTRQKHNKNKKHIHNNQKTRQKTNKILQNTQPNTSQIHQRQTRTTPILQNNTTNIRTTIQTRKKGIPRNIHHEIPDNRLLPGNKDKTIPEQHDKRNIPTTPDTNILTSTTTAHHKQQNNMPNTINNLQY